VVRGFRGVGLSGAWREEIRYARRRHEIVGHVPLTGLDASEVCALEAAVPAEQIAGARYPAPGMATLDSER
jgi:hypothetical protein